MAQDAGNVDIKEVDADGYCYTCLSFLEMCTQWGGWTLVNGNVSKIKKVKSF